MAIEVERIKVVIEGDDSGLEKIEQSAESTRRSVKRLGDDTQKVLKDIRTTATAAAGELARSLHEGITKPAIDAAKSWIEAGSDIGEQLSKVKTLLGESGAEIDAWSKTTARGLGISRREALTFAGDFASILRPMGFAKKASADMSRSLVQLAGDLASLSNTSVEDALTALKSGLVGESEPLRRFGVNLSEVTIKAEALKLGLIKTLKDGLSPAQKSAATYSLILHQTSLAQGDVARTSESLANQQRFLKAEFEDLKAELGARFVPVALQVVNVTRQLLSGWSAIPAPLQNVALAVGAVLAAIGPMILIGNQASFVATTLRSAWAAVVPVLEGVAVAVGATLGELVLIIGAVIAAAVALYFAWRNNFGGLRDFTDKVIANVSAGLNSFAQWLSRTLPTALSYISLHIQGTLAAVKVFAEALGKVLSFITKILGEAIQWIATHWREMLQVFLNMQPLYWLYRAFETIFGGIKKLVGGNLDFVADKLKDFLKLLSYITIPGQIARLTGGDKIIMDAWNAYKSASKGFSAEAIASERKKIEAELAGMVSSVAKFGKSFKLPAMPKMPGLASGLNFAGMGLPGLPDDGSDAKKKKSAAERAAEDLRRRMEQINEELKRLTLDRYQFERWQAQQQFDEDIKLGVAREQAQTLLSQKLRKINAEEGEAHQKAVDAWLEAQTEADGKRLKSWEKLKETLTKAWRDMNEDIAKFNQRQAEEFSREQREAAEEVAKALEKTAGVSERIREAIKDLAAQFDAAGGRASYFEDTLAKLNLQNEALTADQRDAVQVYAQAWQELDRINAKQKAIQQTAGELQGVFRNAFAAGLRNAKDFTKELVSGVKEAIYRQLADLASAYVVKQLMNLFGVRNSGLSESARSARNDLLIAAAAITASAYAMKEAAKEARKAAGSQAGAAAGASFGPVGAVVGAIFGGLFADGGTMRPGTTNIVGERGTEIVTMGHDGRATVTPIPGGSGGGTTVNQYFYGGLHGMGGTEQVKRELRRALTVRG